MGLRPLPNIFFSKETDFSRQILTSKVPPSAERITKKIVLLLDHMCRAVEFGTACAYVDTFHV